MSLPLRFSASALIALATLACPQPNAELPAVSVAEAAFGEGVLNGEDDEHGGFYDSVPPPSACEPDALPPKEDPTRRFDHLGFRVPLIAISPWARRGHVSHEVTDHTSVIRFIATRFHLAALTRRDANADPLLGLFDFSQPNLEVPALLPCPRRWSTPREAQCRVEFPNSGGP